VRTDPEKKRGVSDKKIVAMASAHERLRLQVKELESEMEPLKKAILEELKRRGTKLIENGGVKVTRVAQGWTEYSYDLLRQQIGKDAGRYRVKKVDIAALSVAVQSGKVDSSVIDNIATTGEKSAYISVTFASPAVG
jgi:hypothetical protein